ncbi:IPT/TIG domain-containing protein [Tessaracoccus terricola]
MSPDTGPVTGGTEVIIRGDDFTGATGVDFGGVPGTNFTVIDDTTSASPPLGTPPGAWTWWSGTRTVTRTR